MKFLNYIWGLFPQYFDTNDTYKDDQGDGLLKRYIKSYEQELDVEFMPFVENFLDIIDVAKTNTKYLIHLSYLLGSPIGVDNTPETYRKILEYAVAIYRIKGTKKSYQLLFNIIGMDIDIIEELPKRAIKYDKGFRYDENPIQKYDQVCENCSYYSIIYTPDNNFAYTPTGGNSFNTGFNSGFDSADVESNETPPDIWIQAGIPTDLLAKFSNIICFIQPINAKLRGYIKRLIFSDLVHFDFEEDTPEFENDPNLDGMAFDEGFDDGFPSPPIGGINPPGAFGPSFNEGYNSGYDTNNP